jgi:hypothetical protein
MGYPILLPLLLYGEGVASHVRGLFPEHHRAALLHARLLPELRLAGEAVFVQPPDRAFPVDQPIAYRGMLFVHLCMRYFYPPEMHHPARPPRPLNETVGFFLVNAVIYSLVAGLSVAIKMTDGWYRVAAIQRELEKERAEAELQNLKSQLNPHFLFNTLNNIYSLIAFSPEKAQEAVHDLSRLLRYVLYESSQPFVPLEKDFDFLRNYVELMRIRLPKHVELKTNIVASSPGTLIAPLLFISLVENAFKHGVSNNKPSFIHLDIHQEGAEVVCTIVNSYFPKSPDQDKSGSGIGLVNLEKRLGLLYSGHFSFQCGREGDNYSSYLSITINETEI